MDASAASPTSSRIGSMPDPRCSFYCATKTQFTDVETHIWIIGLLRYLKKTALSDLNVTDEGEYWETENAATLTEKREFLKGMIDQLAEGLSNTQLSDLKSHPSSPSELDLDSLVVQIEKIARDAHAKRKKNR
jgi:hypothetical protein